MNNQLRFVFESIPELQKLEKKILKQLLNSSFSKKVPEKACFQILPEYKEYVFFIHKGMILISEYYSDGQEKMDNILGPTELFGLADPAEDKFKRQKVLFATALKDSEVFYFQRRNIISLLKDSAEIRSIYYDSFEQKIKSLENRLDSIIFKSTKERINDFYVCLLKKHGKPCPKGQRLIIQLSISQSIVAKLTNSSRQSVNTCLNKWRKEGICGYDKNHFWMLYDFCMQHESYRVF